MKKLFYSGLTALMMLFAMPGIVRAQGEGDGGETPTTTPKVTITLSATTWDGTTEADLPKFTVTAPDGITIGNGEGEVAVKVNFYKIGAMPEVEFDQFIETGGETTVENPDGKLTEGQWALSYALVQGNNHDMDYMDAEVDVAASHQMLTVGNASSVAMVQIFLMPTSWTEGSEDGIGVMVGIIGGDMEMGVEENDLAVLIEFTKDETVKKTLVTTTSEELNPTEIGLTAGEWTVSYKFVKGNSTVDDYTEIDNVEAGSESTSTITIVAAPVADPEIELICQVMGPVSKNWPVILSIESENNEVGFGAYDVYYTLDGTTTPSKENYTEGGTTIFKVSGTGYDEEDGWNYATIRFTEACTLKAIAYVSFNGKDIASDEIEEDIVIFNGVPTPEFPIAAGNVPSGTVLKLALPEVEIPGMGGPGFGPMTYDGNKVACAAFYTLDGKEPDVYAATIGAWLDMETTTEQYVDRIGIELEGEVDDQITVKVVYAYVDMEMQMGYLSDVATAQYTIVAGIPAPEIDPFSGEVSVGDKVYITANDADEIYYSVNAEETLTVANGTKLEDVNYIEITADIAQGGSVKIQALAVQKGTDGADDVVSAVATAEFTIKAPVTITFDPANGAEVEVGDKITLTPSREVLEMLYRWYASEAAAEEEWDDEGAEYYSEGKPTVQAGKPVLKVTYAEKGADVTSGKFFYATYTIKAGETPVDPNKLAAPKFMTDSYGESHYAKKTDKVRLVLEDYDSIELYYAVVVEETEDAGGFKKSVDGELTYTKYDTTLISLGEAGEALNVTVKAFALKGEKSSDTVDFTYTMIENIDAYLTFKASTGKNYPLYFTVYSDNYENIMNKDFMVYYTFTGTAPTMEGYYEQEGDTIKYTAQIQQEEYLEMAYCELTQDTLVTAKAYVMLDADAEVILEVDVESHRVTVNSIDAPTFNMADNQEYNDTIKVVINAPEVSEDVNITIYYTLDGSEPLFGRMNDDQELIETVIFQYWPGEDTIKIARNTTLKAIAYGKSGGGPMGQISGSDIATANYKFATELTFNPASGSTVEEGTKVAIAADNDVDIFYMMFESEEAAKAAEWDQEKAESYSGELQPVLTPEKTAIKAAYAHIGAEAISGTFFYASYTVTELPEITLTFNPASGSEVEDSTAITVTASRETEIFYLVYADSAASVADTLFDRNAKEVSEDGKPMITKGNTYLKCAVYSKGEMKYFYASYTIKEQQGGDSTAVETKELAGVNIYPNPTEGEFNVVAPANANVEIFNAAGVLVKRVNVSAGANAMRLENSGIYFVRVRANGQVAIKKVVVR